MGKNEYLCTPKAAEPLIGRVVYRGNNNANANGGVSCAYAIYAPSNSYSYVGSRLAFRGQIVRAASVEAFKSITEVTGA